MAPTSNTKLREFRVAEEFQSDRRGPVRWIMSHLWRHPFEFTMTILTAVAGMFLHSLIPVQIGKAFDTLQSPEQWPQSLLSIIAICVVIIVLRGPADLVSSSLKEVLANLLQRDAREELEISLLSKSQTFHNQQRIGDIMARATNDVRQLGMMIMPGAGLIFDSLMAIVFPITMIGFVHPQLLIVPGAFIVALYFTLHNYNKRLNPVSNSLQMHFGMMNATLSESISGIELVKSTAQEEAEKGKFHFAAGQHRDFLMEQGQIQARYWPMLILGIALAIGFGHAIYLVSQGLISLGDLVAFMGLASFLRFPTFISIFTFTLVQMGRAGAERILELLNQDTELDENPHGHVGNIRGEVNFDHVYFGYDGSSTLQDISFTVEPGECIAIVGQTGTGKSTITKLVNRIFDATSGSVSVDAVDVKDWNMASLRSQISTIEQDIFLFSRTLTENISFGLSSSATQVQVEEAARQAQAHDFITSFQDGYETNIGERGVTLSGGQRQRIAIARALLTDPRILIIDDSTSAVDSATEDEIQRAINTVMADRTTFLITHRIAQIRKADKILVLGQGEVVDLGSHQELMERCSLYRHIFLRIEEPVLEEMESSWVS